MHSFSWPGIGGVVISSTFFFIFRRRTRKEPYNLYGSPRGANALVWPFLALASSEIFRFFEYKLFSQINNTSDIVFLLRYPWPDILFHLIQIVAVLGFCKAGGCSFATIGLRTPEKKDLMFAVYWVLPLIVLSLFRESRHSGYSHIAQIVRFAFVGVAETLVFQAFLQTRLQSVIGEVKGLWATAVVFGGYHMVGDTRQFLNLDAFDVRNAIWAALVLGPILGYILSKQKSSYPLMLIHTGWDIFARGVA
jgi:membrane protease YdiL (CAAX protease family)